MLFSDLATGYDSDDERLDTAEEDDDFGDHLVFESEFLGLSSNDFDDFGYDYRWE